MRNPYRVPIEDESIVAHDIQQTLVEWGISEPLHAAVPAEQSRLPRAGIHPSHRPKFTGGA